MGDHKSQLSAKRAAERSDDARATVLDRVFAAIQHLLPQHALSRWMGRLAASETVWVKSGFIRIFSALYDIDLAEAERSRRADYRTFNDFFTRALKPGVRPFPADERVIACPADGTVSQSGRIEAATLLQAKGVRYSLDSLAGQLGDGFDGGSFVTVYLAPHNYHRVHTPCAGVLTVAQSLPGALFSVNARTAASVPGLFCRNERLVCRLATPRGDLLIVLVGALIVGSIVTPWAGPASPSPDPVTHRPNHALGTGDELGRFQLGSTVILCAPAGSARLDALPPGKPVRVGEAIGTWI